MNSLSPSLFLLQYIYLTVPKGMPKAILKACKIKSKFLLLSHNAFHAVKLAHLPLPSHIHWCPLPHTSLRYSIIHTGSKFAFSGAHVSKRLPSLNTLCPSDCCYFRPKRWVIEIYTNTLTPAQAGRRDSACHMTPISSDFWSSHHTFKIKAVKPIT